jgi:hypothetical protein
MKGGNNAILQEIMPHVSICEWGDADTETITRDIMTAAERKLPAISVGMSALPVADALAGGRVKIFAFTDDASKLPMIEGRENVSAQLFATPEELDGADISAGAKIIPTFQLKDVEHLDWEKIARRKNEFGGFMLIDGGKNGSLHKFYDFLNAIGDDFAGEIHYCGETNDTAKLAAARRLVWKIRPDMLANFRLFVSRGFFGNLDNAAKSI